MIETIWLLTAVLANGHVIESLTMDQRTCRKAEYYAAAGLTFQIRSSHGPIPVHAASCVRYTAQCPHTGQQLTMLERDK